MICRKRLAIMVRGQQNIIAIQVGKRNIGSESLLGMDQHEFGFSFRFDQMQNLAEWHSFPLVIKTAPAGYTVKIACVLDARQLVEFLPRKPRRLLYQSPDAEIPFRWIKSRDRAVVQHRPFQRKRLSRRQTPFPQHLLLFVFALITAE